MEGVRWQVSGVRRNFGKSRVLKKLTIARTIQLFAIFTKARYHYSYIEGFWVVISNEVYYKAVFKMWNVKNVLYFWPIPTINFIIYSYIAIMAALDRRIHPLIVPNF